MASAALVLGAFDVRGLIGWLIVGLIAGFLASRIMRGGGYGVIGDIIVGLIGAFIGGLIVNLLFNDPNLSWIMSIVVSVIGACIFIAILRAVAPGARRTL